jgi:predicted SAM-dependent methyltransferase
MTRLELLHSLIDRAGRGLEIGPSYNPIAPKSAGWQVEIVDHMDAPGLRAKYQGHNVDTDRIEPVDFIADGRPLAECVGKPRHYDWILASHVIEHVPDLIGFIEDCATLLRPEGRLVLAVPDKRRCFDQLQPITLAGAVLQAHAEQRQRHPAGLLFDSRAYDITRHGGAIVWLGPGTEQLRFAGDLVGAAAGFDAALAGGPMADIHAWRFTPSSFRLLIADLVALGRLSLREQVILPQEGPEFLVVLGRGGPGCPVPRETLAETMLLELSGLGAAAHVQRLADGNLVDVLRDRLALAEARAVGLENSTSWWLTAPLRAAMRRLRGAG